LISNDFHNIVILISKNENIDLASSLNKVYAIKEDYYRHYFRLKEKLLSLPKNKDFEKYITLVEHMLGGHVVWLQQALRYM